MRDVNLFRNPDGSWITNGDILRLLEAVGAGDAGILYIHSAISFGSPNPALSRKALLAELFAAVTALQVPTICVPTFTFSFCNGQDYNVQTSASRMGALNEYIRRLPEAKRSIDPLMSSAVVGTDTDLVVPESRASIGAGSTFDKLHARGRRVKFLFIGTSPSECLTYSHYVEERIGTPYRYNREFSGRITDGDRTWQDTWTLFVRYKGVIPSQEGKLEKELLHTGALRRQACGSDFISCVSEPDVYETASAHLAADLSCYVSAWPKDCNMDFFASDMVSL